MSSKCEQGGGGQNSKFCEKSLMEAPFWRFCNEEERERARFRGATLIYSAVMRGCLVCLAAAADRIKPQQQFRPPRQRRLFILPVAKPCRSMDIKYNAGVVPYSYRVIRHLVNIQSVRACILVCYTGPESSSGGVWSPCRRERCK